MLTSHHRLLLLAVLPLVVALGCGEPVKVPTSYAKWEPEGDAIFHVDYPEGWKADGGGGKTAMQWAEFKKGGCIIEAKTDISTSAVADIAQSFNNLGSGGALSQEEMEERSPVAVAHAMNLEKLPHDQFSSYKEEKQAVKFTASMSEGRKSVFTATAGVGRKVKGYRATLVAQNNGVTFYCYCSEKEFEKMKPAFDKVLESVRRGG